MHGHHPVVLFRQSRPMTFAAWAVIGFFMVLSAVDGAYGVDIGTALGDCAIFGLAAGLVACALHVDLRVAADRLILNGWLLTTVIPMGSVVAVHGDDGLYVVAHEGRYRSSARVHAKCLTCTRNTDYGGGCGEALRRRPALRGGLGALRVDDRFLRLVRVSLGLPRPTVCRGHGLHVATGRA